MLLFTNLGILGEDCWSSPLLLSMIDTYFPWKIRCWVVDELCDFRFVIIPLWASLEDRIIAPLHSRKGGLVEVCVNSRK